MKTIQSPDGVALLMENLWLRHRAGMGQDRSKVFMVELPPAVEDEPVKSRRKTKENIDTDDESEDLYGAWV